MEVYYALLRDGQPEELAKEIVASFESRLLDFTFRDVQAAMGLRLEQARRRRKLSYVDALGYSLAQKRRLRFLTGDPAFRRLPG